MRAEILPDHPEARPSGVIMQRARHLRAAEMTDGDMLLKPYVQNRDQLLSHGDTKLRRMALQIIEEALEASNPYHAAKKLVHLDRSSLRVGSHSYDLSKKGNIYVLGTGKATFPIAKALEEVLGDRITRGLVVLKKGQAGRLKRIKVIEASHPIPDGNGLRGARESLPVLQEGVRHCCPCRWTRSALLKKRR